MELYAQYISTLQNFGRPSAQKYFKHSKLKQFFQNLVL